MAQNLKLQVALQGLNKLSKPFKDAGRSAIGLAADLKQSRSALKALQGQQSDISSFKALKGQSEQTGAALQAARQKVNELRTAHVANTAELRKNQAAQRAAIREATALKAAHSKQQTELQGLRGKLSAAGISTRNLSQHERDLRSRITATNQAMSQQEARLKRLSAQQKRLGDAKAQYDKAQGLAGSMAASGAGGMASGAGILYAGKTLFAPGVQFDYDMSKVQALTRLDKDDEQLALMRAQARQLGADTMFSATDAAQGQGFLAMAGFSPQAILDAMPGLLDAAKAGDVELAETADIVSNILTGFNLKAAETSRLGDVMVGAFTRSNTSLQMLGETMKYAGPVAASVGQDIETVSAMAGKLGDAGIQGSMAGTALRAILNRLSAPPAAAAKALDKLGISAKDSAGNLRNMPELLTEIYQKTKDLGTADRAGLLKGLAGEEAVAGMQVLVAQAGSGELQKFIATLRETRGEAARTAKVMGDNLVGDLDELSSAWEDLGIQLQEQQNGPLRGLTQDLASIVGGVKAWITENPRLAGGLVKAAAGIGVLMAAGGALTLALASVIGPFAMLRYGMTLLGIKSLGLVTALKAVGGALMFVGKLALANPIVLAVAAIAGAAYLLYRNWDRVGPYFQGLWAEVQEGFAGGLGGIGGLILNFSPLGLFYRAFAGVMGYFGVDLPAKFSDFGSMLLDGLVLGIKNKLGAVKDAISGVGDATVGWFKEKLGIHSPSRVFAELGGFTMAGLEQGLNKGEAGPLGAMGNIAKHLASAGAIALGSSIALDSSPAMAASRAAAAPAVGNVYNITINAAPGMNEQAIARAVATELARIEQARAARSRSALHDTE